MSIISKEELEDLYKTFKNLEKIKNTIFNSTDLRLLDEILKLRADVEKLKAKQTPTSE